MVKQDYFILIGIWSDHPGKQCYHENLGFTLISKTGVVNKILTN
jgi:hypothetical protein